MDFEIPMTDEKADTIGNLVVDPKSCDPCMLSGKESTALKYCNDCEEKLCDNCVHNHSKRKATSTHKLIQIQDIMNKAEDVSLSTPCADTEKMSKAEGSTIAGDDRDNTYLSEQLNGNKRDAAGKEAKKNLPGKPEKVKALADSLQLSWNPPASFGKHDFYQISFKEVDRDKKWRFYQGEFKSSTAVLNNLKSNTAFIFRVRVVYEDDEGPYSEDSEAISTASSPATRIINTALLKQPGKPSPSIYFLPVTEMVVARNERAKTRKIEFGAPSVVECASRTIMLVGAAGTGKSTLIDGIVNYVLGVNWDDPFRFTVVDLDQKGTDGEKKAFSQTEWITCYTLHPAKGSRLNYQLDIIDTPGFGDTCGLDRVEQIRNLLSEKQPKGVTCIDAVCFLIKAPDARLTAVQSYIFQSVMLLFGKDIERNICSLITFADGIDPPVLAALIESGLPFGHYFIFNNSGLFAKNVDINAACLSRMFWDMGLKSFRAFFDHLGTVETRSLQLTKDVLDERSKLEATLKNLQPLLDAGRSKVNCLKQEIMIIEQNKYLIRDNKNFEYEIEETYQKKKELPRGQHVTNCTKCHFTCHDDCGNANDDEKNGCDAMDPNGNCKICPDKCHWKKHANTPYIFEYVSVKVKKTYADMQKRYQEATGKLQSQKVIVETLGEELCQLLDNIEDVIVIIKSSTERLAKIALMPNPLTMTQHIDLLIE